MVPKVKPPAEGIEATIPRPSRSVVEPACQLLDENLLTPLTQGLVKLSVGVTLGD
jgi:hypothetical protein